MIFNVHSFRNHGFWNLPVTQFKPNVPKSWMDKFYSLGLKLNDRGNFIEFGQIPNYNGTKLADNIRIDFNNEEELLKNFENYKSAPKEYKELSQMVFNNNYGKYNRLFISGFSFKDLANKELISIYKKNPQIIESIKNMENYEGKKIYNNSCDIMELFKIYNYDAEGLTNLAKNTKRYMNSKDLAKAYQCVVMDPEMVNALEKKEKVLGPQGGYERDAYDIDDLLTICSDYELLNHFKKFPSEVIEPIRNKRIKSMSTF